MRPHLRSSWELGSWLPFRPRVGVERLVEVCFDVVDFDDVDGGGAADVEEEEERSGLLLQHNDTVAPGDEASATVLADIMMAQRDRFARRRRHGIGDNSPEEEERAVERVVRSTTVAVRDFLGDLAKRRVFLGDVTVECFGEDVVVFSGDDGGVTVNDGGAR